MKNLIILAVLMFSSCRIVLAQEYVFDPQVFASVVQNSAVRSSAGTTHQQYLGNINNNLNDMNANVSTVVLAQNTIYNALSNVNSAIKDGLEVKYMATIVSDIINYTEQCTALAKDQPYLLLAANRLSSEMRSHATLLANDVSAFITKEGDNVLMDYNARDQLLRKVTQQMQVLDGLACSAWRAMYWAKERGIIATLNPFAAYIYRDKMFVSQIISNAKYLRQ